MITLESNKICSCSKNLVEYSLRKGAARKFSVERIFLINSSLVRGSLFCWFSITSDVSSHIFNLHTSIKPSVTLSSASIKVIQFPFASLIP